MSWGKGGGVGGGRGERGGGGNHGGVKRLDIIQFNSQVITLLHSPRNDLPRPRS